MNSKKTIIAMLVGSVFAIAVGTVPIHALACSHEKEDQGASGEMECSMKKQKEGHKEDGGMHGGKMKHDHDHNYAQLVASQADALQLTDEQLDKILRLQMKDKEAHKRMKERIHKHHQAFEEASMQPATDDATIRRLGERYVSAHHTMVERYLADREAVHAILTPEQKNKLKTLKIEHDMHDGGHGGGGHDHGSGGEMHGGKHGGDHGGGDHDHERGGRMHGDKQGGHGGGHDHGSDEKKPGDKHEGSGHDHDSGHSGQKQLN